MLVRRGIGAAAVAIATALSISACGQAQAVKPAEQVSDVTKATKALPPAPVGLSMKKSGSGVSITWQAPPQDRADISGYRVWFDTDNYIAIAGQLTHYSVAKLEPGSWHQVQVGAVNAAGQGATVSAEVTLPEPVARKARKPAGTVTTPDAPVAAQVSAPPAGPAPTSRNVELKESCAQTLYPVADAYNAITATLNYGDGPTQGHQLGEGIVALNKLAQTTIDLRFARLIPSVAVDIGRVRTALLRGTDPAKINTDQLEADTDRVTKYCDVHLDPLGSG